MKHCPICGFPKVKEVDIEPYDLIDHFHWDHDLGPWPVEYWDMTFDDVYTWYHAAILGVTNEK